MVGALSSQVVTWTLLTNDDGIDSPALMPFARALAERGEVRIVVPDRERSWIGKAISRHDAIEVDHVERDGIPAWTCSGYPADAVQLGIHSLFATPPSLVISGINLGYNHGAGFLLSSGTVGAAFEGWVSGVRSVAFSAGTTGPWNRWRRWVETPDAGPEWERLAHLCAVLETDIDRSGLYETADVVSVNLPFEADTATARRITTIARTGYDRLFQPVDPATAAATGTVGGAHLDRTTSPHLYAHEFAGGLIEFGGMVGTDVDVARRGGISITPIRMPQAATVPSSVYEALERGAPE